jgi:hypothetical protein
MAIGANSLGLRPSLRVSSARSARSAVESSYHLSNNSAAKSLYTPLAVYLTDKTGVFIVAACRPLELHH